MKKKLKALLSLLFALIGAMSLLMFAACGETEDGGKDDEGDTGTHTHVLVHHDEEGATCSAAGTEEYWQCSGCNLYFSDAEGKTQITAPKTIEKKEHSFTEWKYEGDMHWRKCLWCEETTEKEAHDTNGAMVLIVESQPTKKDYFVGEKPNLDGLKVVLECYDECGYSEDVTKSVTVDEVELTKDVTSLTVRYGELSSVIGITVSEVVMVDIEVVRKAGVEYYANGLAIPKPSDFTVTAKYNDDTSRELTTDEFTIAASTGFDTLGGTVTVKPVGYNNISKELTFELVEVVMSGLSVKTQPENTTFRTDEAVSLAGMVLTVTYNDGTSKDITAGYVCEQEGEIYSSEQTVKAVVSYTEGDVTESAEIDITISDNDGAVVSVAFAEGVTLSVESGLDFAQADTSKIPALYAVHESGRRTLLTSDEYTLTLPTGTAVMGNIYKVTATLKADTTISTDLAVKVLTKVNGNGYSQMAGGGTNTKNEKEYIVGEGGAITETERVVPYVGGFSKAAEEGRDAYVIWNVESSSSAAADITFRAANSYLKKEGDNYTMDALQINSVADLFVNGEKVDIPDAVVLRGCGPAASYAPLYNIYYTFTIDGLKLASGTNQIKLVFKNSTLSQKNHWGETPSTMNIDYIEVATYGAQNAEGASVESIIVEEKKFGYGDDIAEYTASLDRALGIMSDGTRRILTASDLNVTIEGDKTEEYFKFGSYTVTVALKSDAEKSASWTVTNEAYTTFKARSAYAEVREEKVYLVLTFDCINEEEYAAADFRIYDGTKVLTAEFVERTAKTLLVYAEVTGRASGDFYVHVDIKGVPYDNGEGKTNGDFKDEIKGGKVTDAISVDTTAKTLGAKTYSLYKNYNMAILKVVDA